MEKEKIGNITEKVSKWDPRKDALNQFISYIDLSSVDKDLKKINNDKIEVIKGEDAPSRARQLVKQNDILVSTVRPNLNGVAIIEEDYDNATASTGYSVLRCKENCYFRYLYFWTLTPAFVEDMINKASGASYPAVSDRIIKESKIPLPPLPTQKKIAAILDAADAYRQKTKALIKKYDELSQSLFLDMFGDPVVNPKGWEKKELGLITHLKAGNFVSASEINSIKSVDLYPCYGGNGLRGFVQSYTHDGNFVLIGRQGALCGNVKTVNGKFHATEHAIVCSQKMEYNTLWLYYLLDLLNLNKHATGAAQPGLNVGTLNKLDVVYAPFGLQNQFADRIQKIEVQKAQAQESLVKAEELFNSLLGRAFKGEIN